jgi:hypothetical protein
MSTPNGFELAPWRVGDLRLTAFPSLVAPLQGHSEKSWEDLLGKRPDVSRKSESEVEESGPFVAGAVLSYQRSSRVIQWMVARPPDSGKLQTLLMDPQVLVPFKELMCRWLGDGPPLLRLAFGAALYLPVKDRPEAYRRLEEFLHLGLKYSDEEGDFVYQYNRRRPSRSVPEVKVNRLSKWTWVPLGEVRAEDGVLVFPEESACLLEVDVNTVPEFSGILPHDRYVPLFEELVSLAVEIAARGDVP